MWQKVQSLESVVAVQSSENQTQQRAGPSGPPVEQPRRMRKKCCYSQKSWRSICCSLCSVSNSPLTHNSFATFLQPFQIKCERYIFLKNCVSFVIIVLTMFLRAYEYVTSIHIIRKYLLNLKEFLPLYWDEEGVLFLFLPLSYLFNVLSDLNMQ